MNIDRIIAIVWTKCTILTLLLPKFIICQFIELHIFLSYELMLCLITCSIIKVFLRKSNSNLMSNCI